MRQVAADADRDVHAGLHAALLRLAPEGDLGPEEALLGPGGPAAVAAALRPALADLRYNPARYATWDWLAGARHAPPYRLSTPFSELTSSLCQASSQAAQHISAPPPPTAPTAGP